MTELTFQCTGQDVIWTNPGVYPLVAGSEEIYEAVFTFDEAWDGFHVLGVFENAQSKVVRTDVLLGGACRIPKEVLATPGDLYVGCLGTLGNQKMPTVRLTALKINPGVRDDGSMYIEPAASLWEQMIENIDQIVAEHAITTIPARLTEYEKRTARENIGAADEEEIADARIGYNQVQYETLGDAIRSQIAALFASKADGAYVENGYLYITSNNEVVAGPLGPFSGGGGSEDTNNAKLTVTNETGWLFKTIMYGGNCPLTISWSSIEDEMPTGNGTMKIVVNNVVKSVLGIEQGTVNIDVGSYLSAGANTVKVTTSDVYNNSRTITFTISTIAVSLESSFDASVAYSGQITFSYVPFGNVVKTMHFKIDGTEIGTYETNASGKQQTFTIPSQNHGAHIFEAYFSCTVGEDTVYSNTLRYDLICIQDGVNTPIISSSYVAVTVPQYTIVKVPYVVYTPNALTSPITLKVNGATVSTLTVDRTPQMWNYRTDDMGTITMTISCGSVSKSFTFSVTESTIDIEPETDALSLYLTSYGRSNNEAHPEEWEYGDISATLSNFNFVNDGWVLDDDGNTVLRVSGDARVTIPYEIFAYDFRTSGKTIELEFATREVMNYDATIISCVEGDRGIVVTAQKASMASEQSSISTSYKEDEHVRVSFVVEKTAENRLIFIYINGIASGVVQYPASDDFSQQNPVGISIGSDYCTTDIYNIRVYDNDLTRRQIVTNWIADTADLDEKLDRYYRNDIFDEYGNIVLAKLPSDLPYMVVDADELPQYKGDKKTCSGRYVDPMHPNKSFTFTGAQFDVQGTSSQYYARKNYKVKFKGGFVINNETVETYQMRDDSIPTSTFTFKADVASSEGANNVELAILYNDICPYKTPPQEEDSRIRQGIDGFPIVIFWNNGTDTVFLGKYNFNNDKGTEEVFGFEEGDESWEIKNNTSSRVLWKSANYSGSDWLNDFEGRYPDGYENPTNLAALATWLVSTDTEQATGDALSPTVIIDGTTYTTDNAAYRLAKFKAELPLHMEVNAVIFYYLFTEIFLMVDSRAKNAFPTFMGEDKWFSLPYDFDTALGINNEGALTFGYQLEDTDHLEGGADVFNGQDSVLWVNLRQTYADEIKSMYQTLRSTNKISYDIVETAFENHQAKWSESIFNEDAWFKYIDPMASGSNAYLSMLQGSKAEQRKWWLYNRFRYMDSKYNAGDAESDVITLRGYAKDDISVTPYADIYATVKYGSYLVQARAERGHTYTLVCPLDNVNDTEIYIYSASQLSEIGDLSGLMVGYAEFSMAVKLQELKLGDSDSQYYNGNLKELHLGQNTLLKVLDVRNCALGTGDQKSVDISGCTNIEEIYFDGTYITGVDLPNGGIIRKLHLPDTITNLTIRNQSNITEFVLNDYSNITTLRLENVSSVIDPLEILADMSVNSRVRIIGFDLTVTDADDIEDFYDVLDTMRGLDEHGYNVDTAQVSGTIHLSSITAAKKAELQERYPYIAIDAEHMTAQLNYYNFDGTELLYSETIADGGDGVYAGTPSRTQTAQYTFTFVGWSTSMDASEAELGVTEGVVEDRDIYAAYSRVVRTYIVRYMNGTTVLQTYTNVEYGSSTMYTGATPVPSDPENYQFDGWEPAVGPITGNTDYQVKWKFIGSIARKLIQRTINKAYENNDVTVVGEYAFAYCYDLSSVSFSAATSIGSYAFMSCSQLKSVNFPVATNIGNYAFYNCYSLSLSSVNFPSVTNIGEGAFVNCRSITSVNFPAVTEVGMSAFSGCSRLTSVDFSAATSVASNAFISCSSLTSVNLPVATYIGGYAFGYCYSLPSVSFSAATSIGNYAFISCSSLTSVNLPVATYIGGYAFGYCYSLTTVSLPEATFIGGQAFSYCSSLTSVSFPKVSKLTQSAFARCGNLAYVNFPKVSYIEQQCFTSCVNLTTIIIGAELSTVCILSNRNAFNNTPSSYFTIYVPDSLITSYKAATNWSYFSSRIKGISEVPA